jgi:hypothetical protein
MRMGASVSHDFAVMAVPRGERMVRTLLSCDISVSFGYVRNKGSGSAAQAFAIANSTEAGFSSPIRSSNKPFDTH